MIVVRYKTFTYCLVLFFLFYLPVGECGGQGVRQVESANKCSDSIDFFAQKAYSYLAAQKLNDLRNITDYWADYCGNIESVERLRILVSMKENQFSDSLLSSSFIENSLIYWAKSLNKTDQDTFYYLPFTYKVRYPFINNKLDSLITKEFYHLQANYPEKSLENQLVSFYGGNTDELFTYLSNIGDKSLKVYRLYHDYADKIIRDSLRINIGFFTGLWIPVGPLSILELHPSGGFIFGFQGLGNWGLNTTLSLRTRKLSDPVVLSFQDTLRPARDYFGGNYGIELSYAFKREIEREIFTIFGLGVDGFTSTVVANNKIYDTNISSFNLNIGFAYRFIFKQRFYLELQPRYYFLNYQNDSETNLMGDAITIRLVLGFFSGSIIRNYKLKALDYKYPY